MNGIDPNSYQLVDNYGQVYKLVVSPATIGSNKGCTIVLDDDPNIKDLTAEIRFDGSCWGINILSGERNLISVNDIGVENAVRLNNGDIIKIGNSVLRYKVNKPPIPGYQDNLAEDSGTPASVDLHEFRSTGVSQSITPPPTPEPIAQPKKRCSTCNKEIYLAAEICPYCGVRQIKSKPVGKHSRTTAAILAIVLGDFGAHKFYLGKIGLGILYLVFCWAYVPGILGVVEGINYLRMSDEDFVQRYG
jgi:TM2 domain-containing membrane protein YozV